MRDGSVVYRPSRNGLGLLLVPRCFGPLVVGFCPTAAGADAKRQGVAVGDVVQAAVTTEGQEVTATEAQGEALLRLCLRQTPKEVRLRSGLRFRDKLPLVRLQPGAAEDAIIRALLDSHARVEQRLNVLKEAVARGTPRRLSTEAMDRILTGMQECENALEVLELIACDLPGIPMSPGVRLLYDQAQGLLLQHRREQQTAGEAMNGQAEEPPPDEEPDATQVDTEEQEPTSRDEEKEGEERKTTEQVAEQQQPQQQSPAPASPARGSVRARVFTSPQSSPPPEEAADGNASKKRNRPQREADLSEKNGGGKSDAREEQDGDLPVVKIEQNDRGATQQQSASSWSAVKSGRRGEDDDDAETAADRAAKRARCLLIDLTLDDDDDDHNNDNSVVGATSPVPLSGEEHSRDSVVHSAEQSDPPRPQPRLDMPHIDQRREEDVSVPHSPASNSSTRMDDGGGDHANDALGDTWNEVAPEEATGFSEAPDTQSQFTEMTHDSLPVDDPEYEPSQEIDMTLLSQSPRTTRSSIGPSQETPDRGRRTNLQAQVAVSGGEQLIENEPEYYRAFTCQHQYCRPMRCEMARAMLKHCRQNVTEATAAMRAAANEPMEQSQNNTNLFKDAFFQCGEDFDAIAQYMNSRTRNKLFTIEEIIAHFYNVFKPSRSYVSTLKERKLSGKL